MLAQPCRSAPRTRTPPNSTQRGSHALRAPLAPSGRARRFHKGDTMSHALARLLRKASLALFLVVSASVPSRAQLYPCPLSYGFFTYYDFVSDRNFQYSSRFNIGDFSPTLGPAVGVYRFPTMTSTNGEARLRNGRIAVHCTASYVTLPPQAQPQLVLTIFDDGAGGDLEVLYSDSGGGGCGVLADELVYEPPAYGEDPSTCSGGGGGGGTPSTGGGGGGGSTTCTQFVEEISYDGGQTWTEIDSWWECT